MAASGDSGYEKEMKEIVNRHIEMVYTVIPAGEKRELLLDCVNELLSELKDIFQGIYLIRDLSPKTSSTIVSYGEAFVFHHRGYASSTGHNGSTPVCSSRRKRSTTSISSTRN